MSPALIAGVASGMVGLLVFLTIHHFLIQPIWFILPIGAFVAALGGLAVGWSYETLRPFLPDGVWTIPAFTALIVSILLPALILAQLREPMLTSGEGGSQLLVPISRAVFIFLAELLLTSAAAGGLAGWLIGRSTQAGLRTALAGFIFALGPGHNIPFFSFRIGGVGKSWLLLGAIILSASVTLVLTERLLRTR